VSTCTLPTSQKASARVDVVDLLANWDALQPAWDDFVEAHPKGSIFHTSDIVRVYESTKDYKPIALAAVTEHGEVLAIVLATRIQSLPGPLGLISSRSIWYAEPLCHDDERSISALAAVVAEHDRRVERNTLFTEIRPLFTPGPERIALERCGYEFLDYLNYVVDVSVPPDVIWRNLRRDDRRSIQKSKRAGFKAHYIDSFEGIAELYRHLVKTYKHAGVPLADISLFESAFNFLHGKKRLRLIAVSEGDKTITMHATLVYKDYAFAWYCGTERRPQFSPVDLLKWREFGQSYEDGITKYDLGGAGWPNEPYGVRDFKAKFGGELVQYGRYRKVHTPWRLALAERVYKFKRKLQRLSAK